MSKDISLLRLLNLPAFNKLDELAALIHVEVGLLSNFCNHSHRYYRKFSIPKSNGKRRIIKQPSKNLKAVQAWILRNILDKFQPTPYAMAFIKGKNILDHTSPHVNNRYFLIVDLEEFFPSITKRRIENVFHLMGYSRKASKILASLCTCSFSLPQGGVTSPAISNMIAAKLDRRLAGFTSRRNIIYTRYADDLTFSSNNPEILNGALSRIYSIIKTEHFKPNYKKTRFMGPRRSCKITGLVKNNNEPIFSIGKKKRRILRAIMHAYLIKKKPDPKYSSEASIMGWLSFLKKIDPINYDKLSIYWKKLKEEANANNHEK
jgi:RNA-directed DNA polymerase